MRFAIGISSEVLDFVLRGTRIEYEQANVPITKLFTANDRSTVTYDALYDQITHDCLQRARLTFML